MSNTPLLSVTMPIYNTNPTYLRQAIDSILSQTFTDFEFLILNDSPQNTELDKIVAGYTDPRIRYFKNNKSLGIADGHNFLLDQACGKYIALMDHDDISTPDRFQKQVDFMEFHPQVGICGTACRRFGKLFKNGPVSNPIEDAEIRSLLFFRCPILHPSTIIRRSVLTENHIRWDNRFISVNDRKLYFDCAPYTQLHNLPDILYLYRISSGMTSKTQQDKIRAEQQKLRTIFLNRLGVQLTPDQTDILNNYVLKGRCRIQSEQTLIKAEQILSLLVLTNKKTHFAPDSAFQSDCARYLVKRCKNALFYGHINTWPVLSQTKLPVKIPFWMQCQRLFSR
ncbi:MAG: glycosyltransferase [Alphaproteobacteria bacterium]|nr:glycosyltransferase [Alphaproteobacteria bacterium]